MYRQWVQSDPINQVLHKHTQFLLFLCLPYLHYTFANLLPNTLSPRCLFHNTLRLGGIWLVSLHFASSLFSPSIRWLNGKWVCGHETGHGLACTSVTPSFGHFTAVLIRVEWGASSLPVSSSSAPRAHTRSQVMDVSEGLLFANNKPKINNTKKRHQK